MEVFTHLLEGLQGIMNAPSLLYCLVGVTLGTFIGALPGMGSSAGIAILLPIAFSLDPKNALIMFCGIFYGTMYGGTITSVLLNIPGESSSVLSAFEGFKLAKKGRGGVALGIAAIGSFIAGTLGVIALTFFAPELANKALLFGPAEKFAVIALAFAFVSSLSSGPMSKSFVSLCLGLIAATVGQDILVGDSRLTFGTTFLTEGFEFAPVCIGFFALTEIMSSMEDKGPIEEISLSQLGRIIPSAREMKESILPMTRGTIVGFITGVMPGAGATIATFLSYGIEKKFSKHPEEFGEGSMDAIASTESANNASSAGSMVPLMALAIPGSATTAILLSGFLMFGLTPGPMLFVQHPDIAWGLIASMYVSNVMLVTMNIVGIPFFVWAVKKSTPFMSALVVTITVAGVYSINQYMRDVWLMLICGLVGFILTKLGYSLVSILLGLVLGRLAEYSFRSALIISDGSFATFFEKPICLVLLIICGIMLVAPPIWNEIKKKKRPKQPA
ncbi:MAG: tripartite tricarboxylate transporter permease [Thermodesulfobacteriota bacterium]